MVRPPLEEVLKVIGGATPLLEQLKAAKISLENYMATAEEYRALALEQKAILDSTVGELQAYADAFVALYTNVAETPVEPKE